MAATALIETCDLGRAYGGKWAVRHLGLQVARGEIYGFLGQNGAGKTTTIRMLAALLRPSEGSLRIDGIDPRVAPRALKQRVGLVPDTPPLHDYLTGRQYVGLVASLWHVGRRERDARAERLFALLQLEEAADELCKGYSHGMRKKVHLAAVLATAPPVLLLDEATTGLDPIGVRRLKDLLLEESARGTTILFSTHVLETAEQICHRVGILVRGTLRAEGTVADLRAAHGGASLEDVFLATATGAAAGGGDGPARD
ncbi:MAG: ABC transporter ATP-binding protein [Planctomycetes bacterium]|nr:ABC transporter ATP-binding protein [Planctomycetota bacterium]